MAKEKLIYSCDDCPYARMTDGGAVSCCFPDNQVPYGAAEDSEANKSPPPPECPLRKDELIIRLAKQ